MNVALGIITHRYSSLLDCFISTLAGDGIYFFIHVDKKAELSSFLHLTKEYPHVYFLEHRIDVQWGRRSQIDAEMALFEYASHFRVHIDYLFLVSGDTLPLCSRETLLERLESEPDVEYVHVAEMQPAFSERLKYKWPIEKKTDNIILLLFRRLRRKFKIYVKNPLYGQLPPLSVGFNWVGLTSKSLAYILEYVQANPTYYDAFKYAICGDELFVQTILNNSTHGKYVNKTGCVFEIWKQNVSHPELLDENLVSVLKEAQQKGYFFARKFSEKTNFDMLRKNLGF